MLLDDAGEEDEDAKKADEDAEVDANTSNKLPRRTSRMRGTNKRTAVPSSAASLRKKRGRSASSLDASAAEAPCPPKRRR